MHDCLARLRLSSRREIPQNAVQLEGIKRVVLWSCEMFTPTERLCRGGRKTWRYWLGVYRLRRTSCAESEI